MSAWRPFSAFVLAGLLAGIGLPAAADDLVVREFVIARQVVDNEPVGPTDNLLLDQHKAASAFARFDNPGGTVPITFVWYHEGVEVRRQAFTIGRSPGWRSHTSVQLRLGRWRVDLLDAKGQVIADREFAVR